MHKKLTRRLLFMLLAGILFLSGCANQGMFDPELDYFWCPYDYGRMWCVYIDVQPGPPKTVVKYWACENCGWINARTNVYALRLSAPKLRSPKDTD